MIQHVVLHATTLCCHLVFCPAMKSKLPSWAVQVRQAQQGLSAAISRWEGVTGGALQAPRGLLEASQDGSHPMHQLEQRLVQLQADLKQHAAAAKSAARCCADHFAGSPEAAVHMLSQCCVGGTPLLGKFACHKGWEHHKGVLRTDLFRKRKTHPACPWLSSAESMMSLLRVPLLCVPLLLWHGCLACGFPLPLPVDRASCVRSGTFCAHVIVTGAHSIGL